MSSGICDNCIATQFRIRTGKRSVKLISRIALAIRGELAEPVFVASTDCMLLLIVTAGA